jgi:tetratricopeptide (TPR) repeat protein
MAIDKSHSKPWVKTLALILSVALIFGLSALVFLPELFKAGSAATPTGTTTTGAGSATSTSTINATYQARVDAEAKLLTANPNDYDALVAQGTNYQEWASQLADASGRGPGGADMAYWPLAIDLFKKALAIKPGSGEVETNLGLCYLYSGDVTNAVTTIEAATKLDPTFGQPFYFLGRAYQAAGQSAKAIAAYQNYVKLDPSGQFVSDANTQIGTLQAGK